MQKRRGKGRTNGGEGPAGRGRGGEAARGGRRERVSDRFRSAVRFVSRRARKYRTRVPQEGERLIGG